MTVRARVEQDPEHAVVQVAGVWYLQVGPERGRLLGGRVIVPAPGDRVCRLADGSLAAISATEAPPATTVHVHTIHDHAVFFHLRDTDGREITVFLDTTKAIACRALLLGYPDADLVRPTRRMTAAECAETVHVQVGPAPDHPQVVPDACHVADCHAAVVDGCTVCEVPLCRAHQVQCFVPVGQGQGLGLGYCDRCAYFLLDEPAR